MALVKSVAAGEMEFLAGEAEDAGKPWHFKCDDAECGKSLRCIAF